MPSVHAGPSNYRRLQLNQFPYIGTYLQMSHLPTGLPGLSCSQYCISFLLRTSFHFLAARYHSLISSSLNPNSIVALSSLFHRTRCTSPSNTSSTANFRQGRTLTPSFPLACHRNCTR